MDQISQIKQQLNIVDVIGSYLELKKAGRNYRGLCPFHGEKTPSFMVSPELQLFKCFGCGEAGDIYAFVQKIEGVDFGAALETLANRAGIKLEKAKLDPTKGKKDKIIVINELTTDFYHYLLSKHKAGSNAMEYLQKKRALTNTTIKEFKLGFAPARWDMLLQYLIKKGFTQDEMKDAGVITESRKGYIDKFRNRIVIPLTGIDGRVVGFTARALGDEQPKYLNSPETLVFHKSSFLFGLDKAKLEIKQKGAVFVEGNVDVITAHQEGIKNVIASSGTAVTLGQLKILARYTNDISFCFDPDLAGQNATLRAIELAEKENLNIQTVVIPDKYADLDEYIKANKQEAKKALANPIPIYDFFITAAYKKYTRDTAVGKKQIIEDLAPKFAVLKNSVMLDHYTKQLAEDLDLSEEVIKMIFTEAIAVEKDKLLQKIELKSLPSQKLERALLPEYMLGILFKLDLENAQNIVYKLGKVDFPDENLEKIFTLFKTYIIGRKRKINIKYFIDKLPSDLQEKAQSIFLQDFGPLIAISDDEANAEALAKEADNIFARLKNETISRELRDLENKLKQAEKEKDSAEIKKLTEKVYKFSKQKNLYAK